MMPCTKKQYHSSEAAQRIADQVNRAEQETGTGVWDVVVKVYWCKSCHSFHTGHTRDPVLYARLQEQLQKGEHHHVTTAEL
jgi:hypothetical protein